ncbi:hypothetical protein [Shewanella xiamenensis]|uniref:hypothetical protein n=1 Tax=Shewanella xiamenensis TaxID=332186 RepID=UPI0024A63C27|nr:hypothetical protein [Shewanella xiamenensis]MDI5875203.1 hypothetical protein [Shewanella xiamenensis]
MTIQQLKHGGLAALPWKNRMLYEHKNLKLLEFVDNPIKNMDYLFLQKSSASLLAKILYRIPSLRKFISEGDAKIIFEHLYGSYLKEAKKSIGELKASSNNILNQKYIDEITKAFTKFFRIGLLLDHNYEAAGFDGGLATTYIRVNLLTKLEYHCNRIAESFDLTEDYFYSIATNEKLWLSFFLSEAYLLLNINMLKLSFKGNDIILEPSKVFKDRMKGYWLSEILESNSKISDMKAYHDMSTYLENNRAIPKELADISIDYVLDKVFSINSRFITEDVCVNQRYLFLREIIYFSLVLECCSLVGESLKDRRYFLESSNIRNESLLFIEQQLNYASDARIENNGCFVYKISDSIYMRGSLGFKYGLRKFAGMLLDVKQEQLKGRDFKGELGDFFEKDYVLNYLKELDYFGYIPFDGFKSGNKAEIKGHDVDIVLHDNKRDIYYFIQVKYKFSTLPTYLSEQVKFFNDESFEKGYTKQLLTLKNNFNHQSIRNQLSSRGLGNAKAENSHFILLHNIPFLNFYEHRGVYFYEWNLLRNILQDGKIIWRKDNEFGYNSTSDKLQLHKPEEIIDLYFSNSVNGKDLEQQFDLFKRSKCIFSFSAKNVQCQMI